MAPVSSVALPSAFLLDVVSDIAGALLVLTGVAAGSLRTWAVLTGQSIERVEWLTALGFALGVLSAILIVVIDFGS